MGDKSEEPLNRGVGDAGDVREVERHGVQEGSGDVSTTTTDPNKIDILIRSATPGKGKDINLCLDADSTVDDLKKIIQEKHVCTPHPNEQVVIHGGKVLRDGKASLREIVRIGTHGQPGPFSFHLVVQGKEAASIAEGKQPLHKAGEGSSTATSSVAPSGGSGPGTSFHAPPQRMDGPSTPSTLHPPQHQRRRGAQNVAMVPPGAVAVPYMVVNPVVSAAYGAAFAAVNNGAPAEQSAGTSQPQVPQMPNILPQNAPWGALGNMPQAPGGLGSAPTLDPLQQQQQQGQAAAGGQAGYPPLIPAIAFFPLGVPVLLPATAPPQGFQIQPQVPAQVPNQMGNLFPYQIPGQPLNEPAPAQGQGHHHVQGGPIPRRRRRRVVMYRISIRGLLQLILMLTLLYAYTPKGRFTLLVVLFCVFYIAARPLRRILAHMTRGGNVRQGQPPQPRGILHEILTLVLGFITSVFPAWNINVQDEAEFAAAQDLVNREEAERERARNQPQQPDQQLGRADNAHLHQD